MTFLSLTPDSLRYALYDTWYFSHRGLGYLDNYFFCLSLMNTLLFFEWKLCLWRTNFLPQRAIFAFTWSAMLIFLLKMPHGIKVCCFQSLAVVHLVVHQSSFFNLVPRSQSSVRECRNVRSGKVRYNAISGWLPELRMPHSNLLCDWLFPSVFGFRSVRGRNKNTEKFSLRLRFSCDVLIHTCPLCGERIVRNCFFGRQQRL